MAKARPQTRPEKQLVDPATHESGPEFGPQVGELLRRVALGLTTALLVARAFWASEDAAAGSGRTWIVAVLATAAIGVAGALASGAVRLRIAWTDAAFLTLTALVAFSSDHAADRRPALNMAWEWIALGVVYLMLRNLPRTAGESSAVVACFLATAVALSAYGLAQAAIEFPEMHKAFERDPGPALVAAGLDPKIDKQGPEFIHIRDRVLGSNEPFATFALANSLAGFLVGPAVLALAVALERLRDKGDRPPFAAWVMAAVPFLILLVCFVFTKSRSAQIGFLVGVGIVVARVFGSVPRRVLLAGAAGLAAVFTLIALAGVATKQLDIQVLTESTKSFRYRVEYWRGAAGLLAEDGHWWSGVGPGNFGGAYLKHKLPQSSEEINDPHNLILDVWTSSGLLAVMALAGTLALAFRDLFGPPRKGEEGPDAPTAPDAPTSAAWLLTCGFGGWLLAWPLGNLNPFNDMLVAQLPLRWVVLAAGWLGTVAMGWPLWGRRPVPAWGLGAWVAALVVNLLAAGGIAFPAVAIALWGPIAIGLNLREDRTCGQLVKRGGYVLAFVLAAILTAAIGWFWGSVLAPTTLASNLLAEAEAARKRGDMPRARKLFHEAAEADRYDPNPWVQLALFDFSIAEGRGEPPSEKEISEIANHSLSALEPPRNPESYNMLRKRDQVLSLLIDRLKDPGVAQKGTIARLLAQRNEALRRAIAQYPTNVRLRARLAAVLAEVGDYDGAVKEGQEALRLDELTPHEEKRLPEKALFEEQIKVWGRNISPIKD